MARLPRFRRVADARALQVTDRDRRILEEVRRYRLLDSRQVRSLVGGSGQHVVRRLQALFHAGYLDRPRAQIRYYSEEGMRPICYALGRKGAKLVARPSNRPTRFDNTNLKHLYLAHTLLVAEVMVAFQKACRAPGAPKLLLEQDLVPDQPPSVAFRWAVTVRHEGKSKRVGVVPDRAFALEQDGERVMYFLEADRGTMPVRRRSLDQTSMYRKMRAYAASWGEGIVTARFGTARCRILMVSESPERLHQLHAVCQRLPKGKGLFAFADVAAIRGQVFPDLGSNVLEISWKSACGDERIS